MNWAQAKDRIDSGHTGDKTAWPDPATAPLGTDAEAGGHGTPPGTIARNMEAQAAAPPQQRSRPSLTGWLAVAAAAVIAFGALLLMLI
jgi:hypothetical protein